MSVIFKKWKFLIIGGMVLVFLAYTLDSTVEFALKLFQRSPIHSSPHWQRFTNYEGGYIVEFPSKPFEYHDKNNVLSNSVAVSFHQFVSVLESNQVFMISTLVESFTNNFTDKQIDLMLDTTMKGALGADGKLLLKNNIMLGTNFGRAIEFQKGDKYLVKMRYYKVGNKLQELTALVQSTDQSNAWTTNASYFFDSFSLISTNF